MILSARLREFLQNAKKHPLILHPLLAFDHPDLPFTSIFNTPLF
jgi:hypothetical protein